MWHKAKGAKPCGDFTPFVTGYLFVRYALNVSRLLNLSRATLGLRQRLAAVNDNHGAGRRQLTELLRRINRDAYAAVTGRLGRHRRAAVNRHAAQKVVWIID